ncbi:HAD family hydrolase [Weissella viridescens]|uniref:HAD family hydrolase n=1 Tax=Weissella viridescens TaxID=1629 RepID=A0A3P2RA23_WEIVI|nr:HAD-IC family P-type ATPase [Weissella viridescens]RRG17627.1 HAD family hydrolase [Weissella viridescens]
MPELKDPISRSLPVYQETNAQVINAFETRVPAGLTQTEVEQRLKRDGFNELKTKVTPKWRIFLNQFNNIIVYILLFAAVVTLLMQHYSDAIVIGIVIVINALIGYMQEVNANDALEKIKQMLSAEATVYRAGKRQTVRARELVLGDVVYLEAGDNVPADLRLVDTDNLRIQESSLTGEADSVEKSDQVIPEITPLAEQTNMAFASTGVTNGSGLGIVVRIGATTEIGKISTSVQAVKPKKSPLTRELDQLGTGISWFIIISSVLLFALGWFMNVYTLPVLAMAVITMVVGSMPEGLPAATSIILATGVQKLTKKHAIVKTLPAAETLGAIDIIASDKTGTLTKNEMTIQDVIVADRHYTVTGTGYAPNGHFELDGQTVKAQTDPQLAKLLTMGQLANDTVLSEDETGWAVNGEPTDAAFITAYYKGFGITEPQVTEIDRIPFDSDYRYIAKLIENKQGERITAIKGAPDVMFDLVAQGNQHFDREYWTNCAHSLAQVGKRVIAVGYVDMPRDAETIDTASIATQEIQFLGLVGITDPPRPEVIQAIREMRVAGIKVKMITGDSIETASAIGQQLGLADDIRAMTGQEVDALTLDELTQVVEQYDIFARTTPHNKLKIVQAYQKQGNVTAMVGDGVNDAPALKQADIGVAMGIKGTDVAKDSADMILANDNFSTIKTAIEQGRRLYDNIKKTILFLLPTSFAEGLIVAISILLSQPLPLTPTQLLWINMVSAITIQLAFIFEPAEPGLMQKPPRQADARLMNRSDAVQMTVVSVLIAGMALVIFEVMRNQGISFAVASTMAVNIIIFGKIFYLFNIRTSAFAFAKKVLFANPMAYVAIGLMLALQLVLTYVPFMNDIFSTAGLTLQQWGIVVLAGLPVIVWAELNKWYLKHK